MGKGTCPSPSLPRGTATMGSSSCQPAGKGTCPSSSLPAPEVLVLVPVDTTADPGYMRRKLLKRWAKKWLHVVKKKSRKADVKAALQEAVVEHGASEEVTVSDLREVVGRRLGFVLEGRHRVAFDRALLQVTAKAPAKKEAHEEIQVGAQAPSEKKQRTTRK